MRSVRTSACNSVGLRFQQTRSSIRWPQPTKEFPVQTQTVEQPAADTTSATPQIPGHAQVIQMATAYWVSRAVYVAAQLGIADLLKDGPQDAEALAVATGTYSPALQRVLRSLASVGLFRT